MSADTPSLSARPPLDSPVLEKELVIASVINYLKQIKFSDEDALHRALEIVNGTQSGRLAESERLRGEAERERAVQYEVNVKLSAALAAAEREREAMRDQRDAAWAEIAEAKLTLPITPRDRPASNSLADRVRCVLAKWREYLTCDNCHAPALRFDLDEMCRVCGRGRYRAQLRSSPASSPTGNTTICRCGLLTQGACEIIARRNGDCGAAPRAPETANCTGSCGCMGDDPNCPVHGDSA